MVMLYYAPLKNKTPKAQGILFSVFYNKEHIALLSSTNIWGIKKYFYLRVRTQNKPIYY